jgi:pyridoxamine 5'-phosphate oxidase
LFDNQLCMSNQERNLSDIRNDYKLKILSESDVKANPMEQFREWLDSAVNSKLYEPTAMTLSTCNAQGRPSSRIVLLKGLDEGLVFFTNYESKKGLCLSENPVVAVLFFWPELERQVRIEGKVEKISTEESDSYFCSRPVASQIGAIVSPQSKIIASRSELDQLFENALKEYKTKEIKRPDNWGGYRIIPDYFEFWQGRTGRLHDRLFYQKVSEGWTLGRLAP